MIPNRKRATQKNKRRSLKSTVLLGIMLVAGYTLGFGSICRVVLGVLVVCSVSDSETATRISGPRIGCII
jgi:hypothetical protein